MPDLPEPIPTGPDGSLVEGVARVVGVDGAVAWLEPEQSSSCAGCASVGCGSKGFGTLASRLAARRFPLAGHPDLRVGERVVVGVRGDALIKAALTAYVLPLVAMLGVAVLAQVLARHDGVTLAASVAGLLLGLGIARRWAGRLAARGVIAPRFLRRAGLDRSCRLTESGW
ncbi:MAG: SoxR reducing system RseC family protein [Candidatus Competibacter sp.]|nr:SoxR reducing system RseC family protein [Candidatus Competibacter sp.]